jgi:Na+/proline symporter
MVNYGMGQVTASVFHRDVYRDIYRKQTTQQVDRHRQTRIVIIWHVGAGITNSFTLLV